VSPEWHGWLHYTHDKPGNILAAEFEKPFKQPHLINQSMMRPEFGFESHGHHQPPGELGARVARGRIGPKYESWSGAPQKGNKELRNYADNSETLHIP
jgi:NADH:ubiquinone oxidoreductase subunit